MTLRELRPEALTQAAFAPFGTVIETAGAKSFPINEGTTTRFHALARADVAAEGGAPILSVFRGTARPRPIEIAMMERHPLASQAFFPLSPQPWLVVVAGGEAPGPDDLRAFLAQGNQGVQYARNVWHHPLLTLEAEQDFLILDRAGPGENLEEYSFPGGAKAVIALEGL